MIFKAERDRRMDEDMSTTVTTSKVIAQVDRVNSPLPIYVLLAPIPLINLKWVALHLRSQQ